MPSPRALKSPSTRVNNHAPRLGEWVDLQPLEAPVLPAYPTEWYRRERKPWVVPKWIWDLWRSDSVTSQWSPADIATALELGATWHQLKPEHRLRTQTYLGLNARGRRDLRWRNPVEAESAKKADDHAAELRRLRIVKPTEEGA